jgi:hypothetical protein
MREQEILRSQDLSSPGRGLGVLAEVFPILPSCFRGRKKPPASRAVPQSESKVFSKFIVVGMHAVRRSFPDSERAPISRVSSFAEGCAQMKSCKHAGENSSSFETRVPNKAPEPTSRSVTIPGEPGIAPARAVAHL